MSQPKFNTTTTNTRTKIECAECKDAFEGSHTMFGQVMASEFVKQHKCYQGKKS